MSNLIDDLRAVLAAVNADTLADEANRLHDTIAAHDALAPDWTQAPEWAQWCIIQPSGAKYWFEVEPGRDHRYWADNAGKLRLVSYDYEELPIGIDWRLCIWQRPPAQEPSPE